MKAKYFASAMAGIAAVVVFLLLRSSEEDQGEQIRFQLQWFDQMQFAGFYMAQDMNAYRREDLSVEIISGGYGTRPVELVDAGQADIALAPMDTALQALSAGKNISIVGVVFNKSLICYMSKKDRNVASPKDFEGLTVGIYEGFDTENVLKIIMNKYSLDESKVEIVPAGGSIASFISDQIDIWPSYVINEPRLMELQNIAVDCLTPDALGIKYYSDAIIVNSDFLNRKKETVTKFLRASAEGWNFSEENTERAFDAIYSMDLSLNEDAESKTLQRMMLNESLRNLAKDSRDNLFLIDQLTITEMINELGKIGVLQDIDIASLNSKIDYQIALEAQE